MLLFWYFCPEISRMKIGHGCRAQCSHVCAQNCWFICKAALGGISASPSLVFPFSLPALYSQPLYLQLAICPLMATCLHTVYHSQFLTPGLLKMPWINVALQLVRHCDWEKVWLADVRMCYPLYALSFTNFLLIWNFLLNYNGVIMYSAIMYNVVL